jgi:2-desacetyl-2-hydroxyethyl bacteriochlorophyllide A dehydrogenase
MRALMFDGALKLQEIDPPVRPPNHALLKMRAVGICNTDIELLNGYYNFHGVLGHEFVAEVIEGADEWIGKRVVGEINIACESCDYCQRGIPSQCHNRKTLGIRDYQGAFAEYLTLPVRNLHAVPDSISDDQAVFVEPLASALEIPELVHIQPGSSVIVIGAGKLGLLCAQVLNHLGADVSVVVRRQKPRELLAAWGIKALESGSLMESSTDVVIDCTGTEDGIKTALDIAKPRGSVIMKSTYARKANINLSQAVVKELRLIGTRCGPFPAAIRLLARKSIDVESMIDAHYEIEDAVAALDAANESGKLKVIVHF